MFYAICHLNITSFPLVSVVIVAVVEGIIDVVVVVDDNDAVSLL